MEPPRALPLGVIVPVPTSVNVNVYVLLTFEDNTNEHKFSDAATLKLEPVKSSLLNQLAGVNVGTLPPCTTKLGALDAVPPVVPNTNDLVTVIEVSNPPVPVHVKFVAFVIFNTVSPTVPLFIEINPVPNAIERVLLLLELNIPVIKRYPAIFNVPDVSIV